MIRATYNVSDNDLWRDVLLLQRMARAGQREKPGMQVLGVFVSAPLGQNATQFFLRLGHLARLFRARTERDAVQDSTDQRPRPPPEAPNDANGPYVCASFGSPCE